MGEEEPSGNPQGKKGGDEGGTTTAATVLLEAGKKLMPVLISASSLLGFVAFAGGVILWTRFYAVGVPPEQAVDAVPDGELIATGSVLLLLFGFFGALALVSAFLVDRSVRSTSGMARLLLALFAVEGGVAVVLAGDGGLWPTSADLLLFALPVLGAAWVTVLGRFSALEDDLKERPREQLEPVPSRGFLRPDPALGSGREAPWVLAPLAIVAASAGVAVLMLALDTSDTVLVAVLGGFALLLAVATAGLLSRDRAADRSARAEEAEEAERRERTLQAEAPCWRTCLRRMRGALPGARCRARREPAPERDPREEERCGVAAGGIESRMLRARPRRLELNVAGDFVVLALLGVAVSLSAWRLEKAWLLVALVAAALITAAVWRVAWLANERRVWFGIALFLSVPLFGTTMTMVRNLDEPKVQPVAIIRSDDGPTQAIQGLYVTETDERVYFANVATEGCGDDFKRDGSRLLWVPQDDVVAMSVGPAQDVESAGRSAQEMSNALTPGIETSTGEKVTLRTGGEEDAGDAAETEKGKSAKTGSRLETAGPAVRPEFGRGLTLDPVVATPGQTVELTRPLAPGQEGFGTQRGSEKTLRLNGVELEIEEWAKDTITFRVPENATSGVVTIECEALAGQPYLTVSRKPEARISVKMRPNSNRVSFDSRRSTDEGEVVEREWAISGLTHGDGGEQITRALPPRTGFYRVRLTVTDDEGETDTAIVRLLRLRAPRFAFDRETPEARRSVGDMLKAVSRMAKEDVRQAVRRAKGGDSGWPAFFEPPVAVQINGHADDVGTPRYNARLSWRRAIGVWKELDDTEAGRVWVKAELPPKLTIRGFGESCPIDPDSGRLHVNRRVEVFVLGSGARLIHPPGCHAAQVKRAAWGDSPP